MYQAAWETLGREVRLDIHFTTVGGTGGIADTCTLYSALRIPVAVVADLDILSDTDHLERVLQSLGASNASQLSDEARRVIGLVKQLPPTISEADVRTQILEAIPTTLDWAQEHDATLRTRLQQLARRLDRMRRLKTATSEPLPEYIREPLQALIEGLRLNGLFVVPVGELEEWLATRNIKASKQNKWAWANEAASLIRAVGPQPDDVWAFIGSVGDYLQARFTEFAS